MSAYTALAKNGCLIQKAENIINSFLESKTDNHKVWCYLVNPDGTKIAIQKGCKIESYEYVICMTPEYK